MTKHIAIICNYKLLEERIGGMDYFFWAFNKACMAEGIQVDWFFPNMGTHGDYNSFHIVPSLNATLEQTFIDHITTEKVSYSHVFTHFIELCTSFFSTVKKHQNAKIIAVDHNPRPLQGYALKKRIKKRLKGLLFSKYIDVFVAVSNHAKQALLNDFGNHIKHKVVVIFNGLNVEKYKQKTDFSSHNKFMVASHLRKEKGIQDLILAIKDLKVYDFIIDIYGEGYYEEDLKQMVREFALNESITFKGSVNNLHEIYSKYDYLIHPSHGETFGYAVVESLLSHLPVITTKDQGNVLGLIQENKNGFLFEVNNVDALSSLLETIIKGEKKIEGNSRVLIENKLKLW
jgi:glycosyltransferase involved in cell wall biosynthesis